MAIGLNLLRARVVAYQHVALFYKLELRDWRETKIQVANRIGVSEDDIKQHDGAMNLLTDEMAERVLNALCAGELWEGLDKEDRHKHII